MIIFEMSLQSAPCWNTDSLTFPTSNPLLKPK